LAGADSSTLEIIGFWDPKASPGEGHRPLACDTETTESGGSVNNVNPENVVNKAPG
jgi:hypothetical protein